MNFILDFAVRRWRTRPGRFCLSVVRDMQLEKHGLRLITPEVCVTALSPEGRALSLYQDADKSAQEIAAFSQKDAAKYPEFEQSLGKISKVIGEALATTPPDIDNPSRGDLWSMLKTGRAIRKLGKKDMFRLLRWGPMAVADLASEYFETELLRAVIAARGVFGTFLGPWSAGSALVLLIRAAGDPHPAGSASFAAGGMGAVTQAMAAAAKAAGAEIRTGAEVIEIRVQNGAATGVLLSTGEEIRAKAVISNADPKRTLLKLTDPTHLSPDFVQKLQHYRGNGTVAKVNLALSGLPKFTALKDGDACRAEGAHSHRQRDRLSGAGVRRIEVRQLLAAAVSRSRDSVADRSHAGAGRQARDVDLHAVCAVQVEGRLGRAAQGTRPDGGADAGAVRAELAGTDSDAPDHYAARPGREIWADWRADFPRRSGAGSVLYHASAAGLGAVPDAD